MISATIHRVATSSALIINRFTINQCATCTCTSAAASSSARSITSVAGRRRRTEPIDFTPLINENRAIARDAAGAPPSADWLTRLPYRIPPAPYADLPLDFTQRTITFFSEVLSLVHNPRLGQTPAGRALFASDALDRGHRYRLAMYDVHTGVTHHQGMKMIRTEVAEYIERRDGGIKADADDIFLIDGTTSGMKMLLQLLVTSPTVGVMIPHRHYPVYASTIQLLHGSCVDYYIDEFESCAVIRELESSYDKSVAVSAAPRVLIVVNPDALTGHSLPRDTMAAIVRFAEERHLVLMADEAYHTPNVYDSSIPFTSFKNVVRELNSKVPLISFNSLSQRYIGECGQRGSYAELINIPPVLKGQIIALSCASPSSSQIMTGLMARPPIEGEVSYELYRQELSDIVRHAKKMTELFDQIRSNSDEGNDR